MVNRDSDPPVLREEEVSRVLDMGREERAEAIKDLQSRYGNRRVQGMLNKLSSPQSGEMATSTPGQPLAKAPEATGYDDSNNLDSNVVERIEDAQGAGSSLDPDTQADMESAFGEDFSNVRVHTDSQADELNKDVQARAFTTGQDIFFRSGKYSPGSSEGNELLAHELTHVVQQTDAPTSSNGPAQVTTPDDATEVEAANVAESLTSGGEMARQAEEEEEVMAARQEDEEELQMARQVEEEEEVMAARQPEEEELQMARQAEEEEEVMAARQAEKTLARGPLDSIGKGFNKLAQKLGYKIGSKGSEKILEGAFGGRDFDASGVTVVNEAGIKKEWDARYGEGAYDGSNGQAEGPDGPLEGFTDPDTGEIFINKDAQAVDTVPHEVLHKHEDGAVHAQMGENFNEGFTEFLTQKAVSGVGFAPSSSYPNQLAITKKLASIVGDAAIESAYFDGDVDAVKDALDNAKGAGTFDEVVDALKNDDYGRAGTTIDNGVPAAVPVGD